MAFWFLVVVFLSIQVSCQEFKPLINKEKIVITLPRVPSPFPPPSSPPPRFPPPSPGKKFASLAPPPPPTNNGICVGSPQVVIRAATESDLYKRLLYTPSTNVLILLTQDILLKDPLMMEGGFSCTTIRSTKVGTPRTIRYPGEDAPAIFIQNTNNVFLYDVNVEHDANERSPTCRIRYPKLADYNGNNICGVIHIWKAYGIKVYQASILGRIDVLRSSRVHLDALTVFAPSNMFDLKNLYPYGTPSVVRFMYCGDNQRLVRANNILSNSEIFGGYFGVLIMHDTAGITIKNNNIHNFTFTAIQCGQNVGNVADCMFSTFSHNYIYTETWVPFNHDAAGIYFDTHWVNPGNYLTCNYIKGGRQCIYLDYVSSGVRVDGGVCYNTLDGNKINAGKNNKISSLLFYNLTFASGRFTCINWFQNNCNFYPGSLWASTYYAKYRSPAWLQVAPYLQHLCDATSIDGYQCNPPNSGSVSNSTLSGNCSGFPTHNDLHHIVIDSTISNRAYFDTGSCAEIPFIQKVNVVKAYNISSATALVNNIQKEDFGVDNFGSPVYSMFKNFKSCPRAAVGVQKKLYSPWWKATLSTDFKTSKLP